MINAVFATDINGGFGKGMGMPWPKCSKDMEYFRAVTHGSAIVMGKTTADYMPLPLPYRIPIIVSRSKHKDFPTIDYSKTDLMQSLQNLRDSGTVSKICLIGGTSILTRENLEKCDFVFYTQFKASYEADTFIDKEIIDWLLSKEKISVANDSMIEIFKVAINGKL
jgi:dihydrofolate reductase